jgi:hypothetical protein
LGGRWEDCSEGQPWVGGGGEVGGSWSQAWPLAKAKDLTWKIAKAKRAGGYGSSGEASMQQAGLPL